MSILYTKQPKNINTKVKTIVSFQTKFGNFKMLYFCSAYDLFLVKTLLSWKRCKFYQYNRFRILKMEVKRNVVVSQIRKCYSEVKRERMNFKSHGFTS